MRKFRRSPDSTKSVRPLLIVGSGRSGTTWLADELSTQLNSTTIFEPLHAGRVPDVPGWGVRSGVPGKYIAPDSLDEEFQTFFERLFSGHISNRWTRQDWRLVPRWTKHAPFLGRVAYSMAAQYADLRRTRSDRRLVKLIKANLLTGWLAENFDLDILYVIRHPCQVVGSRMRKGWQCHLDDILAQPALMSDFVEPHSDLIRCANSPVEKLAVQWSVENLVPLSQLPIKNLTSLSFEAFFSEPDSSFEKISKALNVPTLASPAMKSRYESTSWHAPLSRSDGERVLKICRGFGINIYGKEILPIEDLDEISSIAVA